MTRQEINLKIKEIAGKLSNYATIIQEHQIKQFKQQIKAFKYYNHINQIIFGIIEHHANNPSQMLQNLYLIIRECKLNDFYHQFVKRMIQAILTYNIQDVSPIKLFLSDFNQSLHYITITQLQKNPQQLLIYIKTMNQTNIGSQFLDLAQKKFINIDYANKTQYQKLQQLTRNQNHQKALKSIFKNQKTYWRLPILINCMPLQWLQQNIDFIQDILFYLNTRFQDQIKHYKYVYDKQSIYYDKYDPRSKDKKNKINNQMIIKFGQPYKIQLFPIVKRRIYKYQKSKIEAIEQKQQSLLKYLTQQQAKVEEKYKDKRGYKFDQILKLICNNQIINNFLVAQKQIYSNLKQKKFQYEQVQQKKKDQRFLWLLLSTCQIMIGDFYEAKISLKKFQSLLINLKQETNQKAICKIGFQIIQINFQMIMQKKYNQQQNNYPFKQSEYIIGKVISKIDNKQITEIKNQNSLQIPFKDQFVSYQIKVEDQKYSYIKNFILILVRQRIIHMFEGDNVGIYIPNHQKNKNYGLCVLGKQNQYIVYAIITSQVPSQIRNNYQNFIYFIYQPSVIVSIQEILKKKIDLQKIKTILNFKQKKNKQQSFMDQQQQEQTINWDKFIKKLLFKIIQKMKKNSSNKIQQLIQEFANKQYVNQLQMKKEQFITDCKFTLLHILSLIKVCILDKEKPLVCTQSQKNFRVKFLGIQSMEQNKGLKKFGLSGTIDFLLTCKQIKIPLMVSMTQSRLFKQKLDLKQLQLYMFLIFTQGKYNKNQERFGILDYTYKPYKFYQSSIQEDTNKSTPILYQKKKEMENCNYGVIFQKQDVSIIYQLLTDRNEAIQGIQEKKKFQQKKKKKVKPND